MNYILLGWGVVLSVSHFAHQHVSLNYSLGVGEFGTRDCTIHCRIYLIDMSVIFVHYLLFKESDLQILTGVSTSTKFWGCS